MTAIPFVLACTEHGPLIVSRLDHATGPTGLTYGVGHQLLETGRFDIGECELGLQILNARRTHFGDGVVCMDGGANVGAFTVVWARAMTGWGEVIAVEAQERLFYALCGNIALANLFNAHAQHVALHRFDGDFEMAVPDYRRPASYGSLNLEAEQKDLGQPADHREWIVAGTIDRLALQRLDFLKLDIEGMELDAIAGASDTIARCKPIILAEQIKTDMTMMRAVLERMGYRTFDIGASMLAIHESDPTLANLKVVK